MSDFINDCIIGKAKVSDIDNYVDTWHDGDSELSLDKFLGMNRSEYTLYLRDEANLELIINQRKYAYSLVAKAKKLPFGLDRNESPFLFKDDGGSIAYSKSDLNEKEKVSFLSKDELITALNGLYQNLQLELDRANLQIVQLQEQLKEKDNLIEILKNKNP